MAQMRFQNKLDEDIDNCKGWVRAEEKLIIRLKKDHDLLRLHNRQGLLKRAIRKLEILEAIRSLAKVMLTQLKE